MGVNQAIIGGAGNGERLGLGTKSLIVYKNRLILDYLLEQCVKAGISNIVVSFLTKQQVSKLDSQKIKLINQLLNKYPQVKFFQEETRSYGRIPDSVRHLINQSEPFFFFCGQSPQSSTHLQKMDSIYSDKSLVMSGFKYRYDVVVPVAKTNGTKIVEIKLIKSNEPVEVKLTKANEIVPHYSMILDYNFYDNYPKNSGFEERMYFYVNSFIKDGGNVEYIDCSYQVSEIDYPRDLDKLYKSIDFLT